MTLRYSKVKIEQGVTGFKVLGYQPSDRGYDSEAGEHYFTTQEDMLAWLKEELELRAAVVSTE